MEDADTLEDRVAALERAVTDGETDCEALAEAAVGADRARQLADRLDELETEVEELAAATQALRGYVGQVRSVNDCVEERAELALSRVEALEGRRDRPDTDEPAMRSPTGERRDPSSRRHAAGQARDSTRGDAGDAGKRRCEGCGRHVGGGGGETAGAPATPATAADSSSGFRDGRTGRAFTEGWTEEAEEADADGPVDQLRQLL